MTNNQPINEYLMTEILNFKNPRKDEKHLNLNIRVSDLFGRLILGDWNLDTKLYSNEKSFDPEIKYLSVQGMKKL